MGHRGGRLRRAVRWSSSPRPRWSARLCSRFWFWYVANKPNVSGKPVFKSGSASVVITNEGRIPARSLRVMSTSLKPVRDSDEALNVSLPANVSQRADLDGWGDHRDHKFLIRKLIYTVGRVVPHHGQECHPAVLHRDVDHRASRRIATLSHGNPQKTPPRPRWPDGTPIGSAATGRLDPSRVRLAGLFGPGWVDRDGAGARSCRWIGRSTHRDLG